MSSPPSAVTAHPAPRRLPLGAGGAVARVPAARAGSPAARGRVAPCVPSPIRRRGLCRPPPGCGHVPAAAAPLPHAHQQVYESIPKSWELAAAPVVALRPGRSCVPSGWGFHAWLTAGEHPLGVHGGLGLSQMLCSPAFWGRLSSRSQEGAATSMRPCVCIDVTLYAVSCPRGSPGPPKSPLPVHTAWERFWRQAQPGDVSPMKGDESGR